jgi:hypothetical protein
MILAYCFIGSLPHYSIDTIHQARLFFKGDIYFIVSDINSDYVTILKNVYNVHIIEYTDVISTEFNEIINKFYDKFYIVEKLDGREKLFIYTFERFFVLYNLIEQKKLSNVLFIELDNLIYDNPEIWEEQLNKKECAYMFDNYERCISGICYIKDKDILYKINKEFMEFITKSNKFLSEMTSLWDFMIKNKNSVQILPTIWPNDDILYIAYDNYNYYNNSIFDAAALGIYLGGMDPYHTNGIIEKGLKWKYSLIDYTQYNYKWELDNQGRNIPYVFNTQNNMWIKINNLHVHSKQLKDCLSKPI